MKSKIYRHQALFPALAAHLPVLYIFVKTINIFSSLKGHYKYNKIMTKLVFFVQLMPQSFLFSTNEVQRIHLVLVVPITGYISIFSMGISCSLKIIA